MDKQQKIELISEILEDHIDNEFGRCDAIAEKILDALEPQTGFVGETVFEFANDRGKHAQVILSGEGLGNLKLVQIIAWSKSFEVSFKKFGYKLTNWFKQ